MARKKTAKRIAKRTATYGSSSPQLRMEKDFLDTPLKLAALFSKNIKTLKDKESKIKTAVAKSKTKVRLSESKVKNAAKQKTPAGKKQLLAAKKAHAKVSQIHNILEKQLKDATEELTHATHKHAKLVALRKNLAQFEKDWNSKEKTKAKTKVKAKTRTKKSSLSKSKPESEPEHIQPQLDSYETVNDLFRIEETETSS